VADPDRSTRRRRPYTPLNQSVCVTHYVIPKKDLTALPRWVCDYRTLNKYTFKDRSPLPKVDELLRTVATGKIFSILDQTNVFFQTRMREADIPLTAVKTPWGLME
jgi:hypothetical protein